LGKRFVATSPLDQATVCIEREERVQWCEAAPSVGVFGQEESGRLMVVVVVVIVVVPILIGVPLVGIFIPPAVIMLIAIRTRFGEFLAPVLCVGTVRAVLMNGLVKLVIRVDGALLAIVIGAKYR
jgi:hypothetical protein